MSDAAIALAAAEIAAGRDPRAALDRAISTGTEPDFPPEGLSEAHHLAGRIAVALHGGDTDTALALLPDLTRLALTPMTEGQTSRALDQLLATLTVYHDDARALRAALPRPQPPAIGLRHRIKRVLGRA